MTPNAIQALAVWCKMPLKPLDWIIPVAYILPRASSVEFLDALWSAKEPAMDLTETSGSSLGDCPFHTQ